VAFQSNRQSRLSLQWLNAAVFRHVADPSDVAAMTKYYEDHNAKVRAMVPSNRLLDFDVADGWGPLCDFLGLPVPDEPFPRLNESQDFIKRIRHFDMVGAPESRVLRAVDGRDRDRRGGLVVQAVRALPRVCVC